MLNGQSFQSGPRNFEGLASGHLDFGLKLEIHRLTLVERRRHSVFRNC